MLVHALKHIRETLRRAALAPLFALAMALGSIAAHAQTVPLPALGADLAATSVSGLSSGAFMASQFHIAHSSIVVGVGIVAGGPYGCAEAATPRWASWWGLPATVYWASGRCMEVSLWGMGVPATSTLKGKVQALEQARSIDPLAGVARARVYLFTSAKDEIVRSAVVDATRLLYESLGVAKANIASIPHDKARHAFVTLEKGADCGLLDQTFITDCDYDQAGAVLRHIYSDVKKHGGPSARLVVFSQESFTHGSIAHGLAASGFVYVPPDCGRDAPRCRVHVVFHGCSQAGEGFVRDSGYLEWADGNRLIVLFPQVVKQPGVNPSGCWDWVGYSGATYLTRDGPQVAAVKRMLDRLAQPRPN